MCAGTRRVRGEGAVARVEVRREEMRVKRIEDGRIVG